VVWLVCFSSLFDVCLCSLLYCVWLCLGRLVFCLDSIAILRNFGQVTLGYVTLGWVGLVGRLVARTRFCPVFLADGLWRRVCLWSSCDFSFFTFLLDQRSWVLTFFFFLSSFLPLYLLFLHNFYSLLLKHLCILYDRLITFIPSGPFSICPCALEMGAARVSILSSLKLVLPFAVDFLLVCGTCFFFFPV